MSFWTEKPSENKKNSYDWASLSRKFNQTRFSQQKKEFKKVKLCFQIWSFVFELKKNVC